MRPTPVFVAVVTAVVLLAPATARAEHPLGRAWETPIEEGIAKQEQERKDRRPEGILRQAELLAARRSAGAVKVARVYLLARAYGIAGDTASAAGAYREVLGLAGDCYFAHHDLAMLALGRKPPDAQLAERYLRQAIRVHTRYTTGYRKLARLLLQQDAKRRGEAIDLLQRVIDLEPGDLEARHLRARALIAERRYPEAEKEIVALLRKEPRNPLYRDLKASFYLQTGKIDRALRTYRDLAEELPSIPLPVQGYMACLAKLKEQGTVDPEQWLWAFERLYRLTSDPEEKKKLKEAIEEFRNFKGGVPMTPTDPKEQGPPSDERLAKYLTGIPEADGRAEVLGYVYSRTELPKKVLFDAVLRRLSVKVEPSPKVRQWALRVLGRFGGLGMVGLVRLALADPDSTVRTAAVDALLALTEVDDAAPGAVILVLGLYADNRDRALAVAARRAVGDLAVAELPEPTTDTEAARQEAFLAWWRGPVAVEAKIQALAGYAHLRDHYPEDVLIPYVKDRDAFVADAAWRQMAGIAKQLVAEDDAKRAAPDVPGRKKVLLDPARRTWFERTPVYAEGALRGPDAPSVRARLDGWVAGKPR